MNRKILYISFTNKTVLTTFKRSANHLWNNSDVCRKKFGEWSLLKKNREWSKELEKERERLVVMVCVVVHLVNHLNKKPFRPLYIFKHVIARNDRWFALKLGGNLEFSWYSCNILRYCSNRCIVWFSIPAISPAQANRKFPVQLYVKIASQVFVTFLIEIQ
jgi:hypothetical protein